MSSREPQVVVVTGASGGIGRATAHAFARRGARVGLLARGREGLEEAAREVGSLGGKALAIPTDVADYEQVEAAAAAVEERFGEIDVWVNDAMATVFAEFVDTEPEEFRAGDRGHVSRRGVRDDGRVEADETAEPGNDRPGRFGTVLSGDSPPGRLLRREVRDPWLHRLDPDRVTARQKQGQDHDGPVAGGEHDAVQLVSVKVA